MLYQIKKDIIEDTYLSHNKYTKWIKNIKNDILPEKCNLYKKYIWRKKYNNNR